MMTNATNPTDLLTSNIVAIFGCICAPSVRWFNCYCAGVTEYRYDALPLNWRDVVAEGDHPDDVPTIEAVADVIRKHPTAKIQYLGGNDKILGAGHDGRHIDLARELAAQ